MEKYIVADDYIINKNDALFGIIQAIEVAQKRSIAEIRFSKGEYYFLAGTLIQTDSIAHDDGCGDISKKECHIIIKNMSNIKLVGEKNEQGKAATVFVGFNSLKIQKLLPSVLWVENAERVIIKNIAFTRLPNTTSSGVITNIVKDTVHVKVFDTLPCYDVMGAYCVNAFDLQTGALLGESLTYGFGFDTRFVKTGENTLSITSKKIAQAVKEGNGISWHQAGKTDFLLFFGNCKNLELNNVHIYNANSFAILAEYCGNITAKKLVIAPKRPQLFCASRDAFKIYRCNGDILLKDCYVEGVRMDGQNVHSNFLVFEAKLSDTKAVFNCKYAPLPLENHTEVEMYINSELFCNSIKSWRIVERFLQSSQQDLNKTSGKAVVGAKNYINRYEIEFKDVLPDVLDDAICIAQCWEPKSYTCKNTTFKNVAGAGQLLRCKNILIQNCNYINLMNAGILLGAEWSTHCEAGHVKNVLIENCNFDNCGFKGRYGKYGRAGIAVVSQGFTNSLNQNIELKNNTFKNCDVAIELNNATNVKISNNKYENCKEKLKQNEMSVFEVNNS